MCQHANKLLHVQSLWLLPAQQPAEMSTTAHPKHATAPMHAGKGSSGSSCRWPGSRPRRVMVMRTTKSLRGSQLEVHLPPEAPWPTRCTWLPLRSQSSGSRLQNTQQQRSTHTKYR